MATQGTVTINIVGDASRLKKATDEAAGGLQDLMNKMDSVGKSMMKVGAKMSVGLTLPLVGLGKVAFDAASDLNESLSKVNVVFAESAQVILDWSKDSAKAMGISRQEALESAGTFGNLFRAMGIGLPVATEMSKSLVQLASDLASFNNADPSEVLIALRAGLVGEVEPLRKFGVSLSADRVQAQALKMGLWDVVGATEQSVKAQAAYQIILDDTKLAQGDFGRTASGAANQQRIMAAEFKNTAAELGTTLIPIFLKVAAVLQDAAKWFDGLSDKNKELIVYVGLAVAALGPLTTAVGALIRAVSMVGDLFIWLTTSTMGPWLITAGLVAAAVYGLTQAFSSSGGLTDSLDVNAQAFMRLTDAQLKNAAQQILAKLGIEGLTQVVKDLAATSTSTAQALVNAADLSAKAKAHLTGIINDEIEAEIRAEERTRSDAAAKRELADAAALAAWRLGELTAANARLAATPGFTPEGEPVLLTFADGGVVPGPIGAPQLAMVHGGEAVFNPDQLRALAAGGGGGGPMIGSVTIVAPDVESGADALVRRLRTEAFLAGMN